jgi:hypothetical protein
MPQLVNPQNTPQIIPDQGDLEMVRIIAANVLAAGSNHVTAAATIQAAAAAGYSNGLVAPAIPRKSSGIFVVMGRLSISINGGTLADADFVTYQVLRGATGVGSIGLTAASTATGGAAGSTVTATCPFILIDNSAIAALATVIYSLKIVGTNGHTSGVVATTDGEISVLELPG